MQRKFLYTLLLSLLTWTSQAQQTMYVCLHGTPLSSSSEGAERIAESFDTRHVDAVMFHTDSILVDTWPGYPVQEVDSILFVPPTDTEVRERGWWGNADSGTLRYRLRLVNAEQGFDHEACFKVSLHDGICTAANCTFYTATEAEAEALQETINIGSGNDPYIYVKQTRTGTRLYEEWVMNTTLLIPLYCQLTVVGSTVVADLNALLQQRPLAEVKAIIEAWAHQVPDKITY